MVVSKSVIWYINPIQLKITKNQNHLHNLWCKHENAAMNILYLHLIPNIHEICVYQYYVINWHHYPRPNYLMPDIWKIILKGILKEMMHNSYKLFHNLFISNMCIFDMLSVELQPLALASTETDYTGYRGRHEDDESVWGAIYSH